MFIEAVSISNRHSKIFVVDIVKRLRRKRRKMVVNCCNRQCVVIEYRKDFQARV